MNYILIQIINVKLICLEIDQEFTPEYLSSETGSEM